MLSRNTGNIRIFIPRIFSSRIEIGLMRGVDGVVESVYGADEW